MARIRYVTMAYRFGVVSEALRTERVAYFLTVSGCLAGVAEILGPGWVIPFKIPTQPVRACAVSIAQRERLPFLEGSADATSVLSVDDLAVWCSEDNVVLPRVVDALLANIGVQHHGGCLVTSWA